MNVPLALKKIYNHYIIKNLLWCGVLFLVIYVASFAILRFYTHHGEALTVPDLKGMTVHEANQLLKDSNLRGKVSDSIYLAKAKPGTIVSQLPEASSLVKENRTVYYVINAVKPEMVKMPDVVGVSLRQATSILEAQGLKVGKLQHIPDIAKDNVLRQTYKGKDIRKGTKIVKGAAIDLQLGSGYN
ncbi:MAG: PASTA domain-containing protein [Bacteroidales bacterium]|jgi:beta-lactam-binding protein with PASTA domain|nr:PASTA domain-containing protein [Bacteroidales bacterium]